MPVLTFLSKINVLRTRSGLSYGALAERAHDQPGHLHRVFSGANKPKRDTIMRLALALNLDVETADQILKLANFPGLLPH